MSGSSAARIGTVRVARKPRRVSISGKNSSLTPEIPIERFEIFATGLDHPECLVFDRDGFLWAGGEAGQIYRVSPDGKNVEQIASLGSFNAGVAVSAGQELLVCNPAQGVGRVSRDGKTELFASHAGERQLICSKFRLFECRRQSLRQLLRVR